MNIESTDFFSDFHFWGERETLRKEIEREFFLLSCNSEPLEMRALQKPGNPNETRKATAQLQK